MSCTLPLKPLKGILKKSYNNGPSNSPEVYMSATMPRGSTMNHMVHGPVPGAIMVPQPGTIPGDVVPFDTVPPCDDCLQRARRHGSYGDVCQSLDLDGECAFAKGLGGPGPGTSNPLAGSMGQLVPPVVNPHGSCHTLPGQQQAGYCSKHTTATVFGGSTSSIHNPNEKEEIEALESSV